MLEWSTAIREDTWPLFLRFQEGILHRCMETIRRGQVEGTIDGEIDAETASLMIIGSSWMVIQMSFTHWPAERVHRFVLGQLRGAIGADAIAKALAIEAGRQGVSVVGVGWSVETALTTLTT